MLRPTNELRQVRLNRGSMGTTITLQQKFLDIGYDENGAGEMEEYVCGEVWQDVPIIDHDEKTDTRAFWDQEEVCNPGKRSRRSLRR